jgi:DNA-binding PadR family transcriptional regulator
MRRPLFCAEDVYKIYLDSFEFGPILSFMENTKDKTMNPHHKTHRGSHHARGHEGRERAGEFRGEGGRGGHHGRGFGRGGHGFGGGRGRSGGPGRGGMRRGRLFGREELHLMVLSLLSEGPQHGYQLMRAFDDRSGGAYVPSPGVLYPLLAMLEELGEVEMTPVADGKRRQVTLAEAGRTALEAGQAVADAAFARLGALAPAADAADLAPVRRAMTSLKTALGDRLGRSAADAGTELAFAIAAVLDEAAQKIERL